MPRYWELPKIRGNIPFICNFGNGEFKVYTFRIKTHLPQILYQGINDVLTRNRETSKSPTAMSLKSNMPKEILFFIFYHQLKLHPVRFWLDIKEWEFSELVYFD